MTKNHDKLAFNNKNERKNINKERKGVGGWICVVWIHFIILFHCWYIKRALFSTDARRISSDLDRCNNFPSQSSQCIIHLVVYIERPLKNKCQVLRYTMRGFDDNFWQVLNIYIYIYAHFGDNYLLEFDLNNALNQLKQTIWIFHENAYENSINKITAILFRLQCVNMISFKK